MRWQPALRGIAKASGKGLYAYGCDTTAGKWEQYGAMDHNMAMALFSFIHMIYSGSSSAEAFAALNWPDKDAPKKEVA
jgi:hypothetical protein